MKPHWSLPLLGCCALAGCATPRAKVSSAPPAAPAATTGAAAAERWLSLARAAASTDDDAGAIRYYTMALKAAPAASTYVARAERELGSGHDAAASADLDAALRLDPRSPKAHLDRGLLRAVQQKEFAAALDDLRAVPADSRSALYYVGRGEAEEGINAFDRARADYARALEMNPADSFRHHAQMDLASIDLRRRQYALAVADCDTAIAEDVNDGEAYFLRARARCYLGDQAGAAEDLDSAAVAKYDPDMILNEKAKMQLDAGQPAEAVADFSRVLAKDPQAYAYKGRGVAEFELGEWRRAEADFTACIAKADKGAPEYAEFFRLLARRCGKLAPHDKAFAAAIARWPESWAKTVGRYLSGQLSEPQLRAQLQGAGWPPPEDRTCEAGFYTGMTHLLAGERAAAERSFEECLRTGVPDYWECDLARAELRQLHASAAPAAAVPAASVPAGARR